MRWNYVKALGSVVVPVIVALALIGWAEHSVRTLVGGALTRPP